MRCSPARRAARWRLSGEGVSATDADRAVATIERSLAGEGPLTRSQLAERIASAGVRVAGPAIVHLLFLATLRGLIVRGPLIGSEHAFVLVDDWLGAPSTPLDRDRALAELARRYLVGHSPSTERDLARWSGLPLRDVRAGLAAIAGEIVVRDGGLLTLAEQAPAAEPAPPRLLGAFDPLLVGWASREFLVGAHEVVLVRNGIFRPFALVHGAAAATWRLDHGQVLLAPFAPIADDDLAALHQDAADVVRFLGLVRRSPGARQAREVRPPGALDMDERAASERLGSAARGPCGWSLVTNWAAAGSPCSRAIMSITVPPRSGASRSSAGERGRRPS